MKKVVSIILSIIMLFAFSVALANSIDGTYYKVKKDGTLDERHYWIIDGNCAEFHTSYLDTIGIYYGNL